jgi:hypothetical protein
MKICHPAAKMKSTDRQIHFMQVFPEQEAAVISSPTCPHADPVPDTHNTRMWLPSCLISAAGVGHEGAHALRTIRRHTHRDRETMWQSTEGNCFVCVGSLSCFSFQTHLRTIRLQPFWCSCVFVSVCSCLCVCVCGGGGAEAPWSPICVCVCI